MNDQASPALSARSALAAALLAIDPVGLGGAALRAGHGAWRDEWLALLRRLLPSEAPWLRLPPSVGSEALLGGLDLGATLHSGRPVAQRGVLARADAGCVLLPMAERVPALVASHLCAALDRHEVPLQRDGLALLYPARLAVLALDEGASDEERLPAALLERLAFHLRTDSGTRDSAPDNSTERSALAPWSAHDIAQARARLPLVRVPPPVLEGLCAAAHAWGIDSLRAPSMALRAARAVAALLGCDTVDDEHARLAAALVLAPRATQLPTTDSAPEPTAPAESEPPAPDPAPDTNARRHPPAGSAPPAPQNSDTAPTDPAEPTPPADSQTLEDRLIEAVRAAIPAGLLATLAAAHSALQRPSGAGSAGAAQAHNQRGRPLGSRRAEPRSGVRLHLLDTLRAAAPWQRLRQRTASGPPRIHIRREDFHVVRYRQYRPTTTVFVVDASGSAALHRLAEAKGAVELLLAECYVRRDRVAVLAFRGTGTDLLLPPTRSLARAKRSLSALPGGGGTPLAAGLEAATALAAQLARQGDTPTVVLLTDGRANIALNGAPGRAGATEDALAAAQRFRQAGARALLIDTSPQASATAQTLAQTMGAAYLPLPHAGAHSLSAAVHMAARPAR
jgi:magnesium chelatase subunit D